MTQHKSRFERMLDASQEEIYVFDAQTLKFLQASKGALENLGYTINELYEMHPYDCKPFDKETFLKILQPLIDGTKKITYFETVHRRKDGTEYHVDVRLQYIDDEEDDPVFMAIVTDITERRKSDEELRKLAFTDSVSNLYNRRYFMDNAERLIGHMNRSHLPIGFILIDLDNFSEVNNTYGHLVGDEIIKEASKRMQRIFSRKEDLVARYGGDEFLIVCQDITFSDFKKKCQQLNQFLREDIFCNNTTINISASAGGFFTDGVSTVRTLQDLISIVDDNMYEAKRKGRDRAVITHDTMRISIAL